MNNSQSERSDLLGSSEEQTPSSTSIPYPWQLLFDDEIQAHYYFNPMTEESIWADIDVEKQQSEGGETYSCGYEEDYLDELDGNSSVGNASKISTSSVVERSSQMIAHRKEREEALRLEREQQEYQQMRPGPEINERSKKMNRKVDDIFAWEEQRKERMEQRAQQYRAQEAAQNTGKPMLYAHNNSSNASVVSTNSGSSSTVPVEERLHAYEEKRKLKLQQTRAMEVNEARRSAIPTISPHSANLARRRATLSTSSSATSSVALTAADVPGILRDSSTGQVLFQVLNFI